MGRSSAYSFTSGHSAQQFLPGMLKLLHNSMASSSWHTYQGAIQSLHTFTSLYDLPSALPLQPVTIALYLSYLHGKSYSPSTLATHVSAIAFVHKMYGLQDPTNTFMIQKVMQGVRNCHPRCDTRMPITLHLLMRLVDSLAQVCDSHWNRLLYRSMYLLAFFAFLRVGEMTLSNNTLTLDCIRWVAGSPVMRVMFTKYKHGRKPATITLEAQSMCQSYCPLQAWQHYLQLRGHAPGYIFLRADGQPVSRRDFTRQLALSLQACQLSSSLYKAHSFRIGAATYAAGQGFSDAQIRAMGRWHSEAFKRYIRFT